MNNKKLACLMLAGAAFMSNIAPSVGAYNQFKFFHIYDSSEVEEIAQEAESEFASCQELIDKLKDEDDTIFFTEEKSKLQEQSNESFTFCRSQYKNYTKIIEKVRRLMSKISAKISIEERNSAEESEQRKLNQEKEFEARKAGLLKCCSDLGRRFRFVIAEESDVEPFKDDADALSADIDAQKEQVEKLSFQQDYYNDDPSIFSITLDGVFEKSTSDIEALSQRIDKLDEKINSKKEEIQRIKVQKQEFEAKKSGLLKDCASLKRQVEVILSVLEDKTTFEPATESLNKSIDDEQAKIEELNLEESCYSETEDKFSIILDGAFSDVVAEVEILNQRVNKLGADVQRVRQDLEHQLIETAKDDMVTKMTDYDARIIDEFSAVGISGPVGDSIIKMGRELSEHVSRIGDTISQVSTLEQKSDVEAEIRLFESKFDRLLNRKNHKVQRYLEDQRREIDLENLHNPDAQMVLLRRGELNIDDVVGGYKSTIRRMEDLINAHEECARTGKGVPPKGMVLYGEPGTGKTSIVNAVAAWKKMDLVTLKKCSDVEDMSSIIKAKFDEARTLSDGGKKPVIILIDEIDAIGATRIPGKTDKETVALLAELDSLKPADRIIVLATTNLLKSVDSAVIRPGRLEESCEVAKPREDERADILKVAFKGYKLEDGITIDEFISPLLSLTDGWTGAKIARGAERTVQSKLKLMPKENPRLCDMTLSRRDAESVFKSMN